MQQHHRSHSATEKARIEKREQLALLKQNVEALRTARLNTDDFNATMAAAQALVTQITGSGAGAVGSGR